MKYHYLDNRIVFTTESTLDKALIKSFVSMVDTNELYKKRVRDTQHKMHETTTELAEIKESWVYKVLKFIKGK